MPKYYRFRATTPTRKPKRSKENVKDKDFIKRSKEQDGRLVDAMFGNTPALYWYLRRTAWRESPSLVVLPRQLMSMLRESLQLNNRAVLEIFNV